MQKPTFLGNMYEATRTNHRMSTPADDLTVERVPLGYSLYDLTTRPPFVAPGTAAFFFRRVFSPWKEAHLVGKGVSASTHCAMSVKRRGERERVEREKEKDGKSTGLTLVCSCTHEKVETIYRE